MSLRSTQPCGHAWALNINSSCAACDYERQIAHAQQEAASRIVPLAMLTAQPQLWRHIQKNYPTLAREVEKVLPR